MTSISRLIDFSLIAFNEHLFALSRVYIWLCDCAPSVETDLW